MLDGLVVECPRSLSSLVGEQMVIVGTTPGGLSCNPHYPSCERSTVDAQGSDGIREADGRGALFSESGRMSRLACDHLDQALLSTATLTYRLDPFRAQCVITHPSFSEGQHGRIMSAWCPGAYSGSGPY